MDPDVWEYLKYVLTGVATFGAGIITAMGVYIRGREREHSTTVVAAFDKVSVALEGLVKAINESTGASREDLLKHRLRLEATLERIIQELKHEKP